MPRAALAQLGGRPAAEWIKTLESSERLAGLKIAETVPALKLQLSTDQAAALMAQAGFKPVEEIKLFTDKWFVIYGRQ